MAITVSDELKAAAVNKDGSVPVAKLEIFPVSGAISTSKGLTRRIYSGYYPFAGFVTNILNEGNFNDAVGDPSHAKWDTSGDWNDTGGNAEYTFSSNQTSEVYQTPTNRADDGLDATDYTLTYTIAVTTVPDGDFALTLEYFPNSSIPLPYTAGVHKVKFASNTDIHLRDFSIKAECSTATQGQFSIDNIICSSEGIPLWEDNAHLMAYRWGTSPPLGITPTMLDDKRTWTIRWDGYLKCTRPAGAAQVSYRLGYVSTGWVRVSVGANAIDPDAGELLGSGTSPHAVSDVGQAGLAIAEVFWVPITIWYSRSDTTNRRLADERFVLFYKDSIDDEWKVVGSDVTCPIGGRFLNRVGTPVSSVHAPLQNPTQNVYTLILHLSGGAYHFHKSTDMATEFPVVQGSTTRYVLETGAQNDYITITWSDSISHEDVVDVQLIAEEEPPWNVPVTNMTHQSHAEGASTLQFSTGVTFMAFDADDVSKTNFSTYDLSTDSFGIIRRNRLVKAYYGYIVDGQPEYVLKFTGLIQDVKPDHKTDAATISVTCIDARVVATKAPVTKIEDMTVAGVPNELSYDIAQYFPENVDALGGDGGIRPPAYDRWNLATTVRGMLYQTNFNSTQLWAKDAFDNFLIDDRGVYLESTPAYPYSVKSILGARAEVNTTEELIHSEDTGWLSFKWDDEYRTVIHWTENAESKDMPYLYMYGFDAEGWRSAYELCKSFGLVLGVDVEGNVYMRYPDNPVLYGAEERSATLPYLSYGIGWSTVENGEALSGEYGLATTDGAWLLIRFIGTGIKIILPRNISVSDVTLIIDDVIVDGVNELDATTGDQGHTDWTDIVTADGYAELRFSAGIQSYWWYKDGVHPSTGNNPTVFTVCDGLTSGEHRLIVQLTRWAMRFEGFEVITDSVERPKHEFDASRNLMDAGYKSGVEQLVNDVIVTGNQRGVLGDFVVARAVDMASISDENSPNFIGVRKPAYIADPRINNQERADFLAKALLLRHRRGERNPKLSSSGLPWLNPDDPVSIRDMHKVADGTLIPTIGLYSASDLTKAQRVELAGGVQPVPYTTYWIKETRDVFTKNDETSRYVSEFTTTSFPPLPAYEPLPEPTMAEDDTAISNIDISIDNASQYNPFLSDAEGKYVNIEFDLNWHARVLTVVIVAGEANIELPSGDLLHSGDVLNVLTSNTGFVPAGHYDLKWDGWIEGENGGMFAPGPTPLGYDYDVEFITERYSTGAPFVCRSSSGYPGAIGPESFINVLQNRDAAYGASPFSVTLSPNTAPASPPLLYDLETNDGLGLKIDVTLAAPAQVIIPIKVWFANFPAVPANKGSGTFASDSWTMYLRGDETDVLQPGTYTFYFNPSRDISKDGRRVLPFGGGLPSMAHQAFLRMQHQNATLGEVQAKWHVAWHFSFVNGIIFIDKAGDGNIVNPSNPSWIHYNWGGPREASFTKATRTDEFYTWSFLDVKDAV